jgi:hypothetical protein
MSNDFNFGNEMEDFGRDILREVVRTDYGPGCSFNGINGHGLLNHHGGLHDQVTLYQQGVSGSGINFRFFDK